MNHLQTQNLVKNYGRHRVVNGINIEINEGEIVGLLGPNGAGKTTIFYMIMGLVSPDNGSIILNEKNITNFPMYKRAKEGIGYLSQEPSIFRRLTVKDNVLAILETMPITKKDMYERLAQLLGEMNISHLSDRKAFLLSGGEKRRTEIARSMVTTPDFMLLDEPFTGIDPIAIGEIKDNIFKLREKGLGILITDHNVRETLEIIDRAYIIYDGKILISGTAKELIKSKDARKIYLGEKFTL